MKKLVAFSIVAVLCLSLQSAAVVIGDFEGSMDTWELKSGATGTYSTFGVTRGTNSLELGIPGGCNTILERPAWMLVDDIKTASAITMDVTMRNDGGQMPAWWLQVTMFINSDVTGWKPLTGTGLGGVPWDPRTDHVSFEITQEIRNAFANGSVWSQLIIQGNTGDLGGTFWMDNIEIVPLPEPATLSMLGLGALALLKRRKA